MIFMIFYSILTESDAFMLYATVSNPIKSNRIYLRTERKRERERMRIASVLFFFGSFYIYIYIDIYKVVSRKISNKFVCVCF